jgi:crotonobetaine/carnitine-CoA ligase
VGELIFRPLEGPVQMAYWHDAAATQQKVQAGWLRSGDMVHRDATGYLFFHYRQGDAIRRNGEFINPDEVACILAEHPAVIDVFVYGVPAYSGAPGEQDIVAAIVPIDQQQLDTTSIFAVCHRRLPPNAVPSYLHVVPEIPKTLSEKPQKHRLLESFDPCSPNVFTCRVKKF